MRLLQYVKKDSQLLFLAGISFLFFLLKLPSFFEPYWYGDEGIYEVIGFALRHGRALYTSIWDNKPPLLYLIYAVFNGEQGSVRFFSFLVGIGTVFVFFALSKKLFQRQKIRYLVTILFTVLFALPVLEGNIANAENFMLLPIIGSGLIVFLFANKYHEHTVNNKKLFLPGLLLGIAFLIKVVAVFDFAAFFLFVLFVTYHDIFHIGKQLKVISTFILGFVLPFFVTLLYFLVLGQFATFIHSAFTSNVGYVDYENTFIIPQGFLILKLLLLASCVVILFVKRKFFTHANLFILLWTAFSLFNMFFSQRPYTHYVLVLLPSFLLLLGMTFEEKTIVVKRYLTVSVVIISLISIISFSLLGGLFHKTIGYYWNFFAFMTHIKTTEQYYGFFDKNTPNDYALSEFISLHKQHNDTIFLWGNNAQVYRLTNTLPAGRYIVAYHQIASQKTLQETANAFEKVKPTFVLVSLKLQSFPFSLATYKTAYVVGDFAIYERVF